MERHLDEELRELQKALLRMAGMVEESISKAIEALKNRDKVGSQGVIEIDDKIDKLELLIDEKCIDLIALYQPVARDLRFITTGMRINAELERIADLAVDVAQRVLELVDSPMLKPLVDIPKLSVVAKNMVRDSIDSFVEKNIELAEKVVLSDAEANKLRNLIQNELVNDYMAKDPSTVSRAVPLLLIARSLQRICNHATNIAEVVIYMEEGKVIKHHHEELN